MKDMKLVLEYTTPEGEMKTLYYRKTLPFPDMCEACEFIADTVINDDEGYRPYKLGIAQNYALINYFTNVTDEFESDEQNAMMDKVFDIIDHTDVKDRLLKKVAIESWTQVVSYADKMIEYRKTIRPVDRVALKVEKLLDGLGALLQGFDTEAVAEKLGELTAAGVAEVSSEAENAE